MARGMGSLERRAVTQSLGSRELGTYSPGTNSPSTIATKLMDKLEQSEHVGHAATLDVAS